MSEEPQNIF